MPSTPADARSVVRLTELTRPSCPRAASETLSASLVMRTFPCRSHEARRCPSGAIRDGQHLAHVFRQHLHALTRGHGPEGRSGGEIGGQASPSG